MDVVNRLRSAELGQTVEINQNVTMADLEAAAAGPEAVAEATAAEAATEVAAEPPIPQERITRAVTNAERLMQEIMTQRQGIAAKRRSDMTNSQQRKLDTELRRN